MKYCGECGSKMESQWVLDDQRYRSVCKSCARIHYENPRVLVTCLVEHQGRVLLCQRANDPGKGKWSAPGGFMELGETLEQAVVRETREETGIILDASDLNLHIVSTLDWISEVYLTFRSIARDPTINIGKECLAAEFFSPDDIPWDSLAFVEMSEYLRLFFRELHDNQFGIHSTRLSKAGGHRREYQISRTTDIFVAEPATSRGAWQR